MIAAVLFLRYSVEDGWLQPPVRVAIGILVAIALLVVCELKAARRYPVTANALDAAAIAILFATFFAAHALWNLIPSLVAFVLLAVVTALAVLLSIRRESLFIAVLGLLGGFATPALLSTGENRPIPLFAYLLLLNVGLAWVAYRRRWPVLTALTLVFTTIYQWGWVFKFLSASSVPLAMGIFLLFPLAAFAGLMIARGECARDDRRELRADGARVGGDAAAVCVLPRGGAGVRRAPALLFGFLFLIDAGLLALALARRQGTPARRRRRRDAPRDGDVAVERRTRVRATAWLRSPSPRSSPVFYAAGAAHRRQARAALDRCRGARRTSRRRCCWPCFRCSRRSSRRSWRPGRCWARSSGWSSSSPGGRRRPTWGSLYYIAAFFAIATQAVWSAKHLTLERLGTAVVIYTAFGLVSLGVPVAARRAGRALEPAWGGGAVLLLESVPAVVPLARVGRAGGAVGAGAAARDPQRRRSSSRARPGGCRSCRRSAACSPGSCSCPGGRAAAGSVGVLPSLLSSWADARDARRPRWSVAQQPAPRRRHRRRFARGLYLGLIGHLFLLLLATDREWSLPPWPLFAALAVMTLATSAAASVEPRRHAARRRHDCGRGA